MLIELVLKNIVLNNKAKQLITCHLVKIIKSTYIIYELFIRNYTCILKFNIMIILPREREREKQYDYKISNLKYFRCMRK